MDSLFSDADVIHSYTRAHAIADGVLVDLTGTKESQEAGFCVPLAITSAAYYAAVLEPACAPGCDLAGCLWDLLWMLRVEISRSAVNCDRIQFAVYVASPSGSHGLLHLYALSGPGDAGEQVLTLLLEGED